MSLHHAILGFLSYKASSGYDLKKSFDQSVQHFWPADQSQIYRTLSQLEKDGFVEKEVVPREDRLDLKVYHITPAGEAELHQWLAAPMPIDTAREPFLVKVFFAGKLTDEEIAEVLQHAMEEIQERAKVYQHIMQSWLERFPELDNQRDVFFTLLTLEYGLASAQKDLTWLQEAYQRIIHANYQPKEL